MSKIHILDQTLPGVFNAVAHAATSYTSDRVFGGVRKRDANASARDLARAKKALDRAGALPGVFNAVGRTPAP
jgi:hypothetical protein